MPGTSVSVHLDEKAGRRVTKAASLLKKSLRAFLEHAGDEVARQIVLDWSVAEYGRGKRTFSELAEEAGLAIEEIMLAMESPSHGSHRDSWFADQPDSETQEIEPWLYEAVERVMAKLRQEK